MRENEKGEFSAVLSAALEVFGRPVTPASVGVWWEVLKRYEIPAVRQGLTVAIATSRFAPTPADVIAAIDANDGRPSADEAWALTPKDEATTGTWTDEMSEAWFVAADCYDPHNDNPARMAFRQAYDRLVAESRRIGRPCRWSPTLGTDAARRESALQAAVAAGRLVRIPKAALPAPADVGPIVKAITGGSAPRLEDLREADREVAMKHLDKIREILTMGKAE